MKRHRPGPALAVLVVLTLGIGPDPAAGYPIPPVPLWELVEQADLIVLARVERVTLRTLTRAELDDPDSDAHFDRDVAVLRVLETWKGPLTRRVEVYFSTSVVCPAPPRYVEGETVLAFLERGETRIRRWKEWMREIKEKQAAAAESGEGTECGLDVGAEGDLDPEAENVIDPEAEAQAAAEEAEGNRRFEAEVTGRWYTVGLSYGTLYPDAEDVPAFRELVRAAEALQSAGPVTGEARREWLLHAAERRATRWHGLYGLAPATDVLHFVDDGSGREPVSPLSRHELERLARGFVKEPSVDETLSMMLALFAGHSDRDVDRAAVSAVEALVRQDSLPWWLPEAMMRILERYADPNPRYRLGMDEPDCAEVSACSRIDLAALPGIWQDARRELGIPDVPPAKVPARRVRGVGAETPD